MFWTKSNKRKQQDPNGFPQPLPRILDQPQGEMKPFSIPIQPGQQVKPTPPPSYGDLQYDGMTRRGPMTKLNNGEGNRTMNLQTPETRNMQASAIDPCRVPGPGLQYVNGQNTVKRDQVTAAIVDLRDKNKTLQHELDALKDRINDMIEAEHNEVSNLRQHIISNAAVLRQDIVRQYRERSSITVPASDAFEIVLYKDTATLLVRHSPTAKLQRTVHYGKGPNEQQALRSLLQGMEETLYRQMSTLTESSRSQGTGGGDWRERTENSYKQRSR